MKEGLSENGQALVFRLLNGELIFLTYTTELDLEQTELEMESSGAVLVTAGSISEVRRYITQNNQANGTIQNDQFWR